jgi:hypothetical protein
MFGGEGADLVVGGPRFAAKPPCAFRSASRGDFGVAVRRPRLAGSLAASTRGFLRRRLARDLRRNGWREAFAAAWGSTNGAAGGEATHSPTSVRFAAKRVISRHGSGWVGHRHRCPLVEMRGPRSGAPITIYRRGWLGHHPERLDRLRVEGGSHERIRPHLIAGRPGPHRSSCRRISANRAGLQPMRSASAGRVTPPACRSLPLAFCPLSARVG